jgi:putative addiction module killer protein
MEYDIKVYEKKNKKHPFYEWLLDQDNLVRNKIRTRLDLLSLGNFGNSEPVGDGVHEIKMHFGPGYRIYYAMIGAKIVIILCAGHKGTQQKDIKKAKEYLEDYKMRGVKYGKK